MGGAQPLAATMNEGVMLAVEVDRHRIERRLETRYLDVMAETLDEALARARAALAAQGGRSRSASSATPPTSCPSSFAAASCPTSSPTRRAPTTR